MRSAEEIISHERTSWMTVAGKPPLDKDGEDDTAKATVSVKTTEGRPRRQDAEFELQQQHSYSPYSA